MARIFSIQFMYNGTPQHAMITARTTPFFTEYTVAMLDNSIANLLPNNKMLSTSKESLVFSDSTRENEPALMQALLHAVAAHMHAVNA